MVKRILILQHKGGEYISINLSGFKKDYSQLLNTITEAEIELMKPSMTKNVALQIYDTRLNKENLDKLIKWLIKMESNIFRLAIIGARFLDKIKMNKALRKNKVTINRRFIFDWDTAKDWLVGKPIKS